MKAFILLLFYYFVSIQDISRHTITVNCIQHNSNSVHSTDNIVNNNHDDNYHDNHDNNDSNSKKKIIDDTSTTTTTGRGTIVNCSNQLLCNQGHGYSIMDRNQTILFINLRLSNDRSTTIDNDRSSTTIDNDHSRVMVCVTYDDNNIHKQSSSQSNNSQLSCKQNIYHDIHIINQLFNLC